MAEEDGLDRLYEEEMAAEFVRYMNYGAGSGAQTYRSNLSKKLYPYFGDKTGRWVAKLIDWLFSKLGILQDNYVKNRELADIYLRRIGQGEWAMAQVRTPDSYFGSPSTRLISLGGFYDDMLSAIESQQVIRNLGGLAMNLRQQPGLEDLTQDELIAESMKAYRETYYGPSSNSKFKMLAWQLTPTHFDWDLEEDMPNAEYQLIHSDVAKYLDSLKGLEELTDELREDELGKRLADYDREANQVGFEGISTWLKQYIGTTGDPVMGEDGQPVTVTISVERLEKTVTLPVVEVADPNRIYYGLARSLGNTPDALDRLKRLVQYASLDGNKATKAFANRLLEDLIPIRTTFNPDAFIQAVAGTTVEPHLETILQRQDWTEAELNEALSEHGLDRRVLASSFDRSKAYGKDRLRSLLEGASSMTEVSRLMNPAAKMVLNRVLKGFDLWERTMMTMLTDPKTGVSQLVDANQFRPEFTLVNQWAANQQGIDRTKYLNPEGMANSNAYVKSDMKRIANTTLDINANDAIASIGRTAQAVQERLAKIGIDLSLSYVQYAVIENAVNDGRVSREAIQESPYRSLYSLFTIEPDDLMTNEDVRVIVKLYESNYRIFTENHTTHLDGTRLPIYKPDFSAYFDGTPVVLEEKQKVHFTNAQYGRATSGALGRVKRMARGNAIFDEAVLESSYKNAEGKSVYAHQSKTFHLEFFRWFQQPSLTKLKQIQKGNRTLVRFDEAGQPVYLAEDADFYQSNYFLNQFLANPLWQRHRTKFTHFSIDGIRGQELIGTGAGQVFAKKDGDRTDGLTFKGMSPREFDTYLANSFFTGMEKAWEMGVVQRAIGGKLERVGTKPDLILTPVYLGNLETAGTADLMQVPFIDRLLLSNGALSTKALGLLKEEIRKEYDRIQRSHKNLFAIEPVDGQQTPAVRRIQPEYEFDNYNTGKTALATYTDASGTHYLVVPKDAGSYRTLQFSDSIRGLIDESYMRLRGEQPISDNHWQYNLVVQALKGVPFNELSFLDDVLQKGVKRILDAHWQHVLDNGLVTLPQNAYGTNGHTLLDPGYFKANPETGFLDAGKPVYQEHGFKQVGYRIDVPALRHNLGSKFLSDYLNVLSLNQLIHGDAALLYKNDGADMFKRFKGRNGAIISFATHILIPEWGIDRPNDYFRYGILSEREGTSDIDGKGVDEADAQNWESVQARRRALHGMGRLDAFQARMLDKIESGQQLTLAEEKRLLASGQVYNPLKTVAFDGQHYLKKSDSMLSRQLTSLPTQISRADFEALGGRIDPYGRTYYDGLPTLPDGDLSSYVAGNERKYMVWSARPDTAKLHTMRMRLAGFLKTESGWQYQGKGNELDLLMPVSASKMLNRNVYTGDDVGQLAEENVNRIDLNYYGLQTENPSGKSSIVDPTQNLEVILNELDDDLEVMVDGRPVKAGVMKGLWQEYLTRRDDNAYDIAWHTIVKQVDGDGKPVAISLDQFRRVMYDNTLAKKGDKQTLELLEPNEGYNLNLPIIRETFVRQYFSHFSTGVLSQKRAGDAKTLLSAHGQHRIKKLRRLGNQLDWVVIQQDSAEYRQIVGTKTPDEWAALDLSQKLYRYAYDASGNLQPAAESDWHTAAAELLENGELYILDRLRHLKPRWQETRGKEPVLLGRFSETLMPRWYQQTQQIDPALKWLYAVRIPSQDKHSAVNAEWVDQQPAFMGSTMSLPFELVQLSGEDFDVDKRYVSKPEGYWQEGKWSSYGEGDPYQDWINYTLSHQKVIRQEIDKRVASGSTIADARTQVFQAFNLPTTKAEFEQAGGNLLNNGWINNQLLAMMQAAWANRQTLDPTNSKGNQTNTPASMEPLKAVKKLTYKDKPLFESTDQPVPLHFGLSHSQAFRKSTVGKALIGIGANFNLAMANIAKLNVPVSNSYLPHLSGAFQEPGTAFGDFQLLYKDHQGTVKRVFDFISAVISADTDEAKEQLNAYFNMDQNSQGVVLQLVSLGYAPADALLFINQPGVRAFQHLQATKKYALQLPAEADRLYKKDEELALLALKSNGSWQNPDIRYSGEELKAALYFQKYGGPKPDQYDLVQKQVLWDFINQTTIGKEMSQLVRIIKLKKGFDSEFSSFDQLLEASQYLLEQSPDRPVPALDFAVALSKPANQKLASQYLNFMNRILPGQAQLQKELFLRRQDRFTGLYQSVRAQFKDRLLADQEEQLREAVESRLLVDLYQKWMDEQGRSGWLSADLIYTQEGKQTFVDRWEAFRQEFASYTVVDGVTQKGPQADNPLFSMIQPDYRGGEGLKLMKVNTVTKLRPEQQTSLLDGLSQLIYGQGRNVKLAQELFYYYIIKDGFQFRLNSVSKAFLAAQFRGLSDQLDQFMAGTISLPVDLAGRLVNELAGDVNYTDLLRSIRIPEGKGKALNTQYKVITLTDFTGTVVIKGIPKQVTLSTEKLDAEFASDNPEQQARRAAIEVQLGFPAGLSFPRYVRVQGELFERLAIHYQEGSPDIRAADYIQTVASGSTLVSGATGLEKRYTQTARKELETLRNEAEGNPAAVGYYTRVLANLPDESYLSTENEPVDHGTVSERIPPGVDRTIGGGVGQAALDVVRRCHSPDQTDSRAKLSKDGQWDFDRRIKEQEEIALIRWLRENPAYRIDEWAFTRKWEAQGSIQGAEHQLYFEEGYAYKRNNLAYHTTWLQYLDRIALHNWLFPKTALTLIGFTTVDGDLQPVARQKIIEAARGATREEVEQAMARIDFIRERNDDYVDRYGRLRVEDLHDANVFITPQEEVAIFDPVIYRLPAKSGPVTGSIPERVRTALPIPEKTKATPVPRYELWPGHMANAEQREAIDRTITFIREGKPNEWFVIEGKAGTGKSTIVRKVLKEFPNKSIVVSALSHQAKNVIAESIAKEGIQAQEVTLAGLLGMKLDMETGSFTRPASFDDEYVAVPPVETADIIVVDEASMVNEEMLRLIMSEKRPSAKVIFLGDIGQLPPIREPGASEQGKPSPAFSTANRTRLLERVRQGEENPILPFADYYWENSQSPTPVVNPVPNEARRNQITPEGSLRFVPTMAPILEDLIGWFREAIEQKEPQKIKVVVYRNTIRQSINKTVHDAIFGPSVEFNAGELLIFLDRYGDSFQNSDQVQVISAALKSITIREQVYHIWELVLPTLDEQGKSITTTVKTLAASEKNRYNLYVSQLFAEARSLTGQLRKLAMNAAWEAKARFANLDYAYAITSHKAQGSTYDRVIVHEQDILGVGPTSAAEKSQSIYTALTRARQEAIVISGQPISYPPQSPEDHQLSPCSKP
jgi:hypothetical protein